MLRRNPLQKHRSFPASIACRRGTFLLLRYVTFAAAACYASAQTVANYQTDFQGPTPKAGWSYLWNQGGPVGNPANYTPLVYCALNDCGDWGPGIHQYDLDGGAGQRADPAAYVDLAAQFGHPGRGVMNGSAFDVYAIAAYKFSAARHYSINGSSLTRILGSSGGDIRLVVHVDNAPPIVNTTTTSTTAFDVDLGNLSAGQTLYVAIGPDGIDFSDSFTLQFQIIEGPPQGPTELLQTRFFTDPSLISYWRFEGNANDAKGLNNGSSSTVAYGPAFGKFGQGAYFNGSGAVTIPDAPNLDPASAITMTMWIYPTSPFSANEKALVKSNAGDIGGSEQWAIYTGTNYVSLYGQVNTTNAATAGGTAALTNFSRDSILNSWALLTITYDGSQVVTYINGVPHGTAAASGPLVPPYGGSPGPLNIGGENGIGTTFFTGYIDDVAIFSRALSAAEVYSLYSGGNAAGNPSSSPPDTFGGDDPSHPNGFTSEPIDTATGNYFTSHTDLAVRGRGLPFAFVRSYNSLDGTSGPLGAGWTHSFNISLSVDPATGNVTDREGDGHTVTFAAAAGGAYSAPAGVFDSLQKSAGGEFTLTRKNQTKLTFSPAGRLMTVSDRNGNTQTLVYDSSGVLANITDPTGRTFTFSHDSAGHIVAISDPLGRIVHYAYDAAGNLASFQDAAGGVTQYGYDAQHRMTSAIDPRGNTYLRNTYDAQGRVITQTNARGFSTALAYDTPGAGITSVTDPLGNVTKWGHDAGMRLISLVDSLGGAISYTYNAANLQTAITDQLGRVQTFAYDLNGNLTTATDANGNTALFTYDSINNLLQLTDRLGRVTTFTYDSKGNLLSTKDAAGNVTSFTYDAAGEVLTARNARGFITNFTYSGGNPIRIADALGGAIQITYDAAARPTVVKNQLGNAATRAYDPLDRVVSIADPLGDTAQFSHDGNGNLAGTRDPNGKPTAYVYDSTNKLSQVTDALHGVTSYTYNGNTDILSAVDANGHKTAYAYDANRRLISVTDPLGRQKRYAYDAVGNVISMTDGNAKTNTFVYDSLNRLTSMSLSDGNSVRYSYDAEGNRLTMTDWRGTTAYRYDSLNRVTSVATPDGKTVAYSYDAVGNRAGLTYPDGGVAQFAYDGLNRLTNVTDWAGKATSYTYDAAGNLTGMADPNGAASSYQYDAANRLTGIVNRSGAVALSSFGYTLDKAGNRLQMATAAGVNQYLYDDLYRLISWTAPSGQATRWTYGATGNRASMTSPAGTTAYTYDAADEMLTAGTSQFTYDGNGNQISKTTSAGTVSYGWDALNRLLSVTGGGASTQYQYDGDGNRVSQQVPAGTYAYANDVAAGLPVALSESGPDGSIDYLYGRSLIAASSPAFEYYHQSDGLGSTINLTDQAGNAKASYVYDPWGTLLAPDPVVARISTSSRERRWTRIAGWCF